MDQPFKKPKMRANQQGFTLVELAVVLAIIGLLVGGIFAGNSYVTNARQRTIIGEGKLYLTAFKQFTDKYSGAVPGDMRNASDYWTGAPNGTGDGQINTAAEYFYAFKHLKLAGLIPGNYTGVTGGGSANHGIAGTNLPVLAMDGVTGFFSSIYADGYVTGPNALYFDGYYGSPFYMAKESTDTMPFTGFLTPDQAQKIDQKFDNGRADTGWIRAYKSYTNCVNGTEYYVASPSPNDACTLILTQN